MLIAGISFLIGCVWQVAAKRYVALLLIGRIFWGVGVGFADQSVTIYNAGQIWHAAATPHSSI